MIIALLISLIFGASNDLVVIPKFQKYADVHIQENERLIQVKEISKSTKKTRKEYAKEYAKLSKELKRLNASYSSSAKDFEIFHTELKAYRKKIYEFEIERYLSFDQLILDKEWKQIIESSAKDFMKYRKRKDKTKKEFKKQIDKLQVKLDKQIEDKGKGEKAKKIVNSFQNEMEILNNKKKQYLIAYNTDIQNKRLNKEELLQLFLENNLLGDKIYELFVQTHVSLLEQTSEEEWNAIVKHMNKLF